MLKNYKTACKQSIYEGHWLQKFEKGAKTMYKFCPRSTLSTMKNLI